VLSAADKLAAELGEQPKQAQQRAHAGNGDGLYSRANRIATREVLGWLGVEHDEKFSKCVGCGEDGALICADGGLKCLHDRCASDGPKAHPGFRTNVDLVAHVHNVAPSVAAKRLCQQFGVDQKGARPNDRGAADDDSTPEPPPGRFDDVDEPPRADSIRATRIELIDADAIYADLEPPAYLIDGLIVRGTIAEIIAFGFSGKSWMGIDAVNSAGAGVPFLERFATEQGKALYLDYESGKYESRRRLKLNALGRDLATPIAGVSLVTMPALYMNDPAFPSEMERLMDGRSLIVLDTLKAANPHADENSSEMRAGLDLCRRPLERTQCALLVLAHAKKTSGSVTAIDPREAGRGSSAIYDAADTVLHVTYTEGEPLRVQQTKARCGKAVAPFLVEILDAENGGVRVVATDEPKPETVRTDKFEAGCSKVLEAIRNRPGCSGAEYRESLNIRPTTVLAALKRLERDGAIRNAGSAKDAKWFPTSVGGTQ
jgi:hypothetical protein